ncbi:MAG: LytTR family transcriptional regulator DNA-binding domain-containing protein [Bacilli bacterium]|nr:LytTR family transcriptional regulator DNA-binding domain-containing protein [Bacilli bacterium]
MIKFVVIEDGPDYQEIICKIIEKTIFKTDNDYRIEKHNKYSLELSETIKDCSVHKIYILDIDLGKGPSGLEIAKEIREIDWDSEIIFITSHAKLFETVYRNIFNVFAFIEKFVSLESRLEDILLKIISKKVDIGKFYYSNSKIDVQIYYKDITYIYRDTIERKLVIKTTTNKFLLNKTILEISKELDDRFKQIHRACIVNIDRVNMFNWSKGYFELDNGEKVNLCSKNFRKNISNGLF